MRSPSPSLTIPAAAFVLFALSAPAAAQSRREVAFPDVPGFTVLACDLHQHTVFSDGTVWPTVRVEEAWREGLDALVVSDHIEYTPHKDDLPVKHGRSFEIASGPARALGLIPIRGAEITRKLPPGHFNALFLDAVAPLDVKEWRDALKAAADRKAFVFWNHPSFQQPEGKEVWYAEHTEILGKGWIGGIEVANGDTYYPEAHRWCLEKDLAMLGNTDIHGPVGMAYDFSKGEHRPLTLVFARERTAEGIREALFARRTAVWWKENLIGRPQELLPLLEASVEVVPPDLPVRTRSAAFIRIRNRSDAPVDLALKPPADIGAAARLLVPAGRTARLDVRVKAEGRSGRQVIEIPCEAVNWLAAPGKGLSWTLRFPAMLLPDRKF